MTDTNTFCTSYQNIVTAKKQALLFNIPKTRYDNLKNSPYDGQSDANQRKYELDMRRKAEILKYSRNNGQPTKKQSWSQIVNGRNPYARIISQTQIQQGISAQCIAAIGQLDTAPTLSSNAGIPGPAFMIKLNPDVPLYNYQNSIQNVYGVENTTSGQEYNVEMNYDQYMNSNNSSSAFNLFSLYIQPDITRIYKTFRASIPIAVEFSGYITDTVSNKYIAINTFAASNFALKTYFGGNLVPPETQTLTYQFENGSIDLSGTYIKPTNTYDSVNLANNGFKAILFYGNLLVSGIWVSTQPYFSYDFRLFYNFANNSISIQNISNSNIQIIGNNYQILSDTNPKQSLYNCEVFQNVALYDIPWIPSSDPNRIVFQEI